MLNKKNFLLMLVSFIFAILLAIFIISHGIAGYSTYQQLKELDKPLEEYIEIAEKCDSRILVIESNLSSCYSFNNILLEEVKEYSSENSKLEIEKNNYEKIIESLEENLQKKENELLNVNEKYNSLSYNTANNICCKMRVDNPNVNFYETVDNKIVCLEGGTKILKC